MEMMNSFKKTIVENIPKIVIKYNYRARDCETIESRRNADTYIAAKLEQDSFLTYRTYSMESLVKAGISREDAEAMIIDKNKIPKDKRERVMKFEREKTIRDYVELNDYYRELNGLPNLNDEDFVYLEDHEYEDYGIEGRPPVHEINPRVMASIDLHGVIFPRLIKKYPDKKYLQHLGLRRIEIITARLATNFELLYFPKNDVYQTFYKDFVMTYDESKEYFLTVIYNNEFSKQYESYDDFIALSILIMCIQRVTTYLFKTVVHRDFYDVETIRLFLECYNVPFIKAFSTSQLQMLVKNLNILFSNKSNNQVLFDILDILGFGDFNLNKFYLFKQHRLDAHGNPWFPYKTVEDERGRQIQVLDKEAMYDFYFVSVNVKDKDVQSAINSSFRKEPYELFVMDDETWIHDKKLLDKLLEQDFNYVDSKYMNVNIMYKLYEMIFEVTYISRLLVDKKHETSRILVDLPRLTSSSMNLFDMIVTLVCLLCKKIGMAPVLLTSPSKILAVRGFNFDLDFEQIRKDIASRPHILDQRLLDHIYNTTFKTPKDVNDMFVNIRDFEALIVELLQTTTNHRAYKAYKKIYDTVMNIKLNNSVYNLKDGTTPTTFMEYLREYIPEVHTAIELMDRNEANDMIDYIISKMIEMFTDTKYLRFINSIDAEMMDGVLRIMRFFKSYTVDIRDMSIIYLMDSRYYNTIKFFDAITHWKVNLNLDSELVIRHYDDYIHDATVNLYTQTHMNPYDWATFKSILTYCGSLYLGGIQEEDLKLKVELLLSEKYLTPIILDAITSIIISISAEEMEILRPNLEAFLVTIHTNDLIDLHDKCSGLFKEISVSDQLNTYDYTLIKPRLDDMGDLISSILRARADLLHDDIAGKHINSRLKPSTRCTLRDSLTIIK